MPEGSDAWSKEFIGVRRKRLEELRERLLGAEGRAIVEERSALNVDEAERGRG
jgi:RNase P/RNase MRP subunit p29